MLATRRVVIVMELAEDLRHLIRDIRRSATSHHDVGAVCFRPTLLGNRFEQRAMLFRRLALGKALTDHAANIEHADRCQRTDARVHLRCSDGKPTTSANADHADPVPVYLGLNPEIVDCCTEVLGENLWCRDAARRAATLTAERGVEGERDEAALCHALRI